MIIEFLIGVIVGLLIPLIITYYSNKKAQRDFEKRQERYRKMI